MVEHRSVIKHTEPQDNKLISERELKVVFDLFGLQIMISTLSLGSLPGPYSQMGFANTVYWQQCYITVLTVKTVSCVQ